MLHEIGPIGFETNDTTKIRRAFRLGCAGVIVDIGLPDEVATEASTYTSSDPLGGDRITLRFNNEGRVAIPADPASLRNTTGWFAEELAFTFSDQGLLGPQCDLTIPHDAFMRIWIGNG